MDIIWRIFQMQTKIKKIYIPQAYLDGKGAVKSYVPPLSTQLFGGRRVVGMLLSFVDWQETIWDVS